MGFIATRSGLMRFSDHTHLFKEPEDKSKKRRRKKKRKEIEEEEEEDDGTIKEP
jgi:hypothetical protein